MQEGFFMQGAGIIILMCLAVLAIVFFKGRMYLIGELLLRFLCGAAGICVINMLMERVAFGGEVGLNPMTLLTTTILGFPGLAALYGIKIASLL